MDGTGSGSPKEVVMTGAVQQEGRVKSAVLVTLVAGALLLSANGSALAAGKMGGISGGIDRSAYATSTGEAGEQAADGEHGEATVDPVALGGKSGVGDVSQTVRLGGKAGAGDFTGAAPLGGKRGIGPDKTDASGAI
jgi:hypothetical protein